MPNCCGRSRTGVSRDGTPLFPLMPYPHYGMMAEDDVHAALAYVRSLKAIENNNIPERQLNFPLNLIVRTIPKPATPQQRPPVSDQLAYGRYMLRSALCADCHTPIDDRGTPLPGMDFAGGMEFLETGYRSRSANITPDADTGIGTWTEQQFIDRFKSFEGTTPPVLSDVERRQNTTDAVDGVRGHDARGSGRDLHCAARAEAGGESRDQIPRRPISVTNMFDYLTGIYNITPTPFKPDGSLDEPSLRKLTAFTRGTRRQRHDHPRRARRSRQAHRGGARSRHGGRDRRGRREFSDLRRHHPCRH